MAAVSQAVRRLGIKRCQLCNRSGSEVNPLTRHHCDGNPRNNDLGNFLVVHRLLCHTFADFITQFCKHYGQTATKSLIKRAWTTFTWRD